MREQAHLHQVGLAMILNVSQSTISAYELGDRTPDMNMLIAIADVFHVSLDYLVGSSDIRQPIGRSDLNAEEANILLLYRGLTAEKKARLHSYLEGLSVP